MPEKFLISIVGPTAIGKTAMSIKLAKRFNTEIISADSRQFYKELRIGTAVPDKTELAAVPHHFIQHLPVNAEYSVGDFEKDALQKLEELFKQHDLVFMVGGSGLFIDAINEGLNEFPSIDPDIRAQLNQQLASKGLTTLQAKLRQLDTEYYEQVDLQNPQRVIRALEVCLGTPHSYSHYRNQPKKERNFTAIKIGLSAPRSLIYERIEKRVDRMFEEGLLEEAKQFSDQRHYNALKTVGYRELFPFFDGEISLETAVADIKKNTRRFAKRQLTWFRKDAAIKWFPFNEDATKLIEYISKQTTSR